MRRIDDYTEKLHEVLRERAEVESPGVETDVPWGGFRGPDEPPAPTTDEWVARIQSRMYDDDALRGGDWTQLRHGGW